MKHPQIENVKPSEKAGPSRSKIFKDFQTIEQPPKNMNLNPHKIQC